MNLGDNIKRLCLLLIILLTLLMAVCSPFDSDDLKQKYTNVEYSEDGETVTLYIDGSSPVPANRALSRKLAILGHDFFEVAFMYRSGSGANDYIIARGSWEIGEPAGVNGIYRGANGAGADYGAAISNAPANGTGTAIMFAGKKTDKTLLAVGALAGVDNTSLKVITSATKSVSFSVNALKAGATTTRILSDTVPADVSASILTDAGSTGYGTNVLPSNTKISTVSISHRTFHAYAIPVTKSGGNNRTMLRYAINVAASVTGYTPTGAGQLTGNYFEYYRNGIVNADQTLRSVENLKPHFTEVNTLGVTEYYAGSPYIWHDPATSPVSFDSVTTAGTVLPNPIAFRLDPAGGYDNYLFSFAFQLPVHALSGSKTTDTPDPVTWFIRNGYDEYVKELDDGNDGSGGAILVAIGNVAAAERRWLEITNYPRTQYNPANGGFAFNVDALQLKFHTGISNGIVQLAPNNAAVSYAYSTNLNADPENDALWTFINSGSLALTPPPDEQEYLIRVRYTISGSEHYDALYRIMVSSTSVDVGTISASNRYVVSSTNSWTQFSNVLQGKTGVFLLVFSTSFNIPNTAINLGNEDLTLIITANYPNVIIGRDGASNFIFNGNANVTVFMGKWPFDEPILAGGDVLIDYPFSINARGTWLQYPNGTLGGTMFTKSGTGTLNISAPGVKINNDNPTYYPYVPIVRP